MSIVNCCLRRSLMVGVPRRAARSVGDTYLIICDNTWKSFVHKQGSETAGVDAHEA
jgi:hypothetical protein